MVGPHIGVNKANRHVHKNGQAFVRGEFEIGRDILEINAGLRVWQTGTNRPAPWIEKIGPRGTPVVEGGIVAETEDVAWEGGIDVAD